MTNPIETLARGWAIIEKTLEDAGMDGPPVDPVISCRSRAEQVTKAITARLAEQGILLAHVDEIRDVEDVVRDGG